MVIKIKDFPKLESPFERQEIKGNYICIPKLRDEFRWILDKEKVQAQEKFDGTNCSIIIQDGCIKAVMNRTSRIDIWKSGKQFYEGVKQAIDDKKLKPEMLSDGQYFGELIGEKLNSNPYDINGHLFMPFDYVSNHYYFKFYTGWLEEEIKSGMNDKEIFNKFIELFKCLKSIYFRSKGIEKHPEGIVFYNKLTNQMCKLRMDMFDFYKGKKHKWYGGNHN